MNERALERLVRDHSSALYGLLVYRTGDPHLAEDLLADVFERAVKAHRRFDARRGSERTWLTTIALNVWRDSVRRKVAEDRAISSVAFAPPEARDMAVAVTERRALMSALDELPPDEREALALVYGADLTAKQAAKALELPLTTVQGRIYRGLRRLRDLLGEE